MSRHTVALDRALVVLYSVLAVAALVVTGWHNVRYFTSGGDTDLTGYVTSAFANSASSALTTDLAFVGLVCLVFMFVEGRRVGLRWGYLAALMVGSAAVAIAVTFPLFLVMRSVAIRRQGTERQEAAK